MIVRFAKETDYDFIVEGFEENMASESKALGNKSKNKIGASDARDLKEAIRKKHIRVIELGEEPVAFLNFETGFKVMCILEDFFWIDLVHVKENLRGKGLGKTLYKDAVRIAKKKGFKKILIDVFDDNKKSIEFHKKLGFTSVYSIYQKKI